MGCCTQNTTGAGAVAVDGGKRVNYTKGMLLGVDDFVQDQAYEIARRHELARELLGYGTARGLQVFIDDDPDGGPRVHVTPGMAWMPSGAPVCVGADQCASINDWLAHNTKRYEGKVSGTASPLTLHVVLAHAERPVDKVPIPGEPCRDESALMENSRIADGFRLELRVDAPPQVEENAVRDFADWLAKVPVDSSSPPLDEKSYMDQLRAAAQDWLHPVSPNPRDYMFGSPPAGFESTDALLRAALRLWTTELRPLWRARHGCGPLPATPGGDDDAVLLATLKLDLVKGARWQAQRDVTVVEKDRPVLLSLRMVQELIAQNPAPEPALGVVPADAFGLKATPGLDSAYARADHSHGTPVLPSLQGDAAGPIAANRVVALRSHPIVEPVGGFAAGDVLVLDATKRWAPQPLPTASDDKPAALAFGGEAEAGIAAAFARADHVHPVPALPELQGDALGPLDKTSVVALRGRALAEAAPRTGQVLVFNARTGWTPGEVSATVPALGGDLGGSVDQAFVTSLQKVPLKADQPRPGDTLTFDGRAWVPSPGGGSALVETVAAGSVQLSLGAGRPTARIGAASGKATVKIANFAGSQVAFDILCAVPDAQGERKGFVVKLTPLWNPELPVLTALDRVDPEGPDTVLCSVVLFAAKDFTDGRYGFQFEISRFVPR